MTATLLVCLGAASRAGSVISPCFLECVQLSPQLLTKSSVVPAPFCLGRANVSTSLERRAGVRGEQSSLATR